jgi:hypothetical protein
LRKIIIQNLTNYDNSNDIKIDFSILETFDRNTISKSLVENIVKLYE